MAQSLLAYAPSHDFMTISAQVVNLKEWSRQSYILTPNPYFGKNCFTIFFTIQENNIKRVFCQSH